MTSLSEQVLRRVALSPRHYRIGQTPQGHATPIDSRPFTVQEAERHHARELARLTGRHQAEVDEAYRRGRDEGAAGIKAEWDAEVESLNSLVESLTHEFARTRSVWFDACEGQMVEIICQALERILGDRPPDSDRIARALRLAFEQLSSGDRVTVRCHPDEIEFVQKVLAGSSDEKSEFKRVRVVADEQIGVNGCLVETELGVVDARVEKQLAILKGVLAEARQAASA
jgi:flagellar biosynthesis/type III secretory pathway protein FliH